MRGEERVLILRALSSPSFARLLALLSFTAAACSSTSSPTSPDAAADHFVLHGPYLSDLVVTSHEDAGAATPIKLTPVFSPAIHDYYVHCVAGDNVLTVAMTASAGAT